MIEENYHRVLKWRLISETMACAGAETYSKAVIERIFRLDALVIALNLPTSTSTSEARFYQTLKDSELRRRTIGGY